MAEISKGPDAVRRIEGVGGQAEMARKPVSPAQPGDEQREREGGEEAKEFLVEIGEEARRSFREQQAAADAEGARQSEAGTEEEEKGKTEGAIVDVVV